MKKIALLVFSAVLVAIASCTKENTSEVTFAGIEVEVGEQSGNFSKLYILNEGAFPGASTLDLLDFKNKKYCTDIFAQANPPTRSPSCIFRTPNWRECWRWMPRASLSTKEDTLT